MKPGFANLTEQDMRAPTICESLDRHRDETHVLQREGARLLPGFFPREKVLEIGRRFATYIDRGRSLAPAKDRARKMVGPSSETLPLRDKVSAIGLEDPFVNLPEVIELAFDARLLGLATAYFQTVPLLSYVKVRKSFVNAIPPTPTQHFHVDIGTYSIFKVLVYLNDVVPGGGPFCYVQGSRQQKFAGWESKRYSKEEMAAIYGGQQVVQFHASAGDAILADSTGFHCGEKPETADRSILIVNYTVHPEYGFEYPPVRIRREDLEKLSQYARLVADGLRLME
jgi:hypothetical protein